jgi:hypothetical protein
MIPRMVRMLGVKTPANVPRVPRLFVIAIIALLAVQSGVGLALNGKIILGLLQIPNNKSQISNKSQLPKFKTF